MAPVLIRRIRWFTMGERTNTGQHHHADGVQRSRGRACHGSAAERLDVAISYPGSAPAAMDGAIGMGIAPVESVISSAVVAQLNGREKTRPSPTELRTIEQTISPIRLHSSSGGSASVRKVTTASPLAGIIRNTSIYIDSCWSACLTWWVIWDSKFLALAR